MGGRAALRIVHLLLVQPVVMLRHMLEPPRSMNPLLRLLSALQLANLAVLVIRLQAAMSGAWVVDTNSWITLGLNIFIFFGLFWLQLMAGSRIHAIVETAQRIIRTGDVSQRIHDPYGGKEVMSLITVLNTMLDEIEHLLQGVRTVSDSIAHDLRHPLTRLRNHIEELRDEATRESATPEKQQALADLAGECDALLGTFQAILRISNIESARRHSGFRDVQFHRLVQDVIELYEPMAAEKHITIVTDVHPTTTLGDKDLLFQAVTNLIDNAVKYTPEGGNITVQVEPFDTGSRLVIRDSGRGVPDEHKPYIFRRFYRVDASRSTPGSGLGLALVGAIVKLHQGHIFVADNEPTGLSVTVTI